jgi:hypothetical protein
VTVLAFSPPSFIHEMTESLSVHRLPDREFRKEHININHTYSSQVLPHPFAGEKLIIDQPMDFLL